MRKLLIAIGLGFAGLSPALAADALVDIPQDMSPSFSWTGGYVGLQAGYGWSDVDRDTGTFANSYDADGFVGGLHAGYNHQWGNFVLGVEGDIEYSDMSGDDGGAGGTIDQVEINWMGSLRARAGFAIDRALIYGTGGVAFADIDQNNVSGVPVSFSDTYVGWTAGAGVEYAFTDNFTGRLEYRYTDFGSETYTPAGLAAFTNDITNHAVRIGLSYKF